VGEIIVIFVGVAGALAGAGVSSRVFRPKFRRHYADKLGL
jgi:hypothetical protein